MTLAELRISDSDNGIEITHGSVSESLTASTEPIGSDESSSWTLSSLQHTTVEPAEYSIHGEGVEVIPDHFTKQPRPFLRDEENSSPVYGRSSKTRKYSNILHGKSDKVLKRPRDVSVAKALLVWMDAPSDVTEDTSGTGDSPPSSALKRDGPPFTTIITRARKRSLFAADELDDQPISSETDDDDGENDMHTIVSPPVSRAIVPVKSGSDPEIINLVDPRPDCFFCDVMFQQFYMLRSMWFTSRDFSVAIEAFRLLNETRNIHSVLPPSEISIALMPERRESSSNGSFQRKSLAISTAMEVFGSNNSRMIIDEHYLREFVPRLLTSFSGKCNLGKFLLRNSNDKRKIDIHSEKATKPVEITLAPRTETPNKLLPCIDCTVPLENADRENEDVIEDDELRAIMKITNDGQDTSILFPTMSIDSYRSFESFDGLDDELGALHKAEDELFEELAGIQTIPKLYFVSESDLNTHESLLTDDDIMPWTTTESDESLGYTPRRVRRVRFSENTPEFFYYDDTDSDDESKVFSNLQDVWNDFYIVCEDLIDELTFACTRSLDRHVLQHSPRKKYPSSPRYPSSSQDDGEGRKAFFC